MYLDFGNIRDARGLGPAERAMVGDLVDELHAHSSQNRLKRRYYEGRVTEYIHILQQFVLYYIVSNIQLLLYLLFL